MRNKSKCQTKQPNPRSFFLPWVGKGSSRLLDCKLTQKHLSGSREQAVPFPEPRFHSVQRGQVSKRIGNAKGPLEIHTSLPNTSHPDLPLPTSLVSLRTSITGSLPANLSPPPSISKREANCSPSAVEFRSPSLPLWTRERPGSQPVLRASENKASKTPRVLAPWHLHSYSLKARAAEDLETLKASGLLP